MAEGRVRRIGAVGIVLGLLLSLIGVVASVAPASAKADTTGLVCNNQSGDATKDCEGDKEHGTIEAELDGNGDLVFDIVATDGVTEWRQIYLCIPGSPVTQGADCQGNTGAVLPTTAYDVTLPATNTENGKDVTFACVAPGDPIRAVVDASALPAGTDPITWTVHLNTCTGGTDEAFGSTGRTTPPAPASTYDCVAPTGTGTERTLNGTTDDTDVDGATFELTKGGTTTEHAGTAGTGGAWSAKVTDLDPGSYTYTVDFLDSATVQGTGDEAVCAFTVTGPPGTPPGQTPAVQGDTAVLGVTQENTAAAVAPETQVAAAAAAAPATLPRTGLANDLLAPLGAALVLVGVAFLLLGRREQLALVDRPHGEHYRR